MQWIDLQRYLGFAPRSMDQKFLRIGKCIQAHVLLITDEFVVVPWISALVSVIHAFDNLRVSLSPVFSGALS